MKRFVASLRVRDLRDSGGGRASSVYWLHEEILDDSVTLRSGCQFCVSWSPFIQSLHSIPAIILTSSKLKKNFLPLLVRLNRTLDDYDNGHDVEDKEGVGVAEQVQDICAYSRHQGLGHKISGKNIR